MSKHLKLLYSISLLFICLSTQANKDTLVHKKNQYWIYANAGLSLYNKLNLIDHDFYDYTKPYWVNSKIKPLFSVGFEHRRKKFYQNFSFSYVQNEYTSRDFEVAKEYQYNSSIFFEKYLAYQKIKYNVLQFYLGIGYTFTIKPKHEITTSINFIANTGYNVRITNYYSSNQLGYDTTKYTLVKNALYANKKFFYSGLSIGLGLNISYNYSLTKKVALSLSLNSQYNYAINEINTFSNNYYRAIFENTSSVNKDGPYNAFEIRKHKIIAPSIGIKYKL